MSITDRSRPVQVGAEMLLWIAVVSMGVFGTLIGLGMYAGSAADLVSAGGLLVSATVSVVPGLLVTAIVLYRQERREN